MSVFAAFEASSSELVLGPTLEALPSLNIELERQYALDPTQPVAFCWTDYHDLEDLESALARDETIESFDRLDRVGTTALYRLRRSETEVVQAYSHWVAAGGELLECRGTNGRWTVEMRFPDRASFSRYHDFLEREGVALELHRLADGVESRRERNVEPLTDSQREALSLAYEHGFFEIPRETGLSDLANMLDISTQAVSERLRRGQAHLTEAYVIAE